MLSESPDIRDWANFFGAEAGAAASLTGLVIVAISINLSRILSFPQLPGRAIETLVMLVGVLLVSSVGLAPGQPKAALGMEIFAIGSAMWRVARYRHIAGGAGVAVTGGPARERAVRHCRCCRCCVGRWRADLDLARHSLLPHRRRDECLGAAGGSGAIAT